MEAQKVKIAGVEVAQDVSIFIWILAQRLGETVLLQLIQNIDSVDLGTWNKYKPMLVLAAEFIRNKLFGTVADTGVDMQAKFDECMKVMKEEFADKNSANEEAVKPAE